MSGEKWKYFRRNILPFIAIGLMALIWYYQGQTLKKVEALEAEEILQRVVVFNLEGDKDKKNPTVVSEEGAKLTFGEHNKKGFWVEWEKEKEKWCGMQWELHRRHYTDTNRYFLYFEGNADKEGSIYIVLVDNEERAVQAYIKVEKGLVRKLFPFAEFERADKLEGPFNWQWVDKVRLAAPWGEKSGNKVYCNKMAFLFAM